MKHHPFGPSRQKALAICPGHLPTKSGDGSGQHENTRLGSIAHAVWETGDGSLADVLYNPEEVLKWVDDLDTTWLLTLSNFSTQYGPTQPVLNEITLHSDELNFGTADKLVVTEDGKAALLGDAKFGAWSVDHAAVNHQGQNYAVLVWDILPSVEDVWVFFGNPRRMEYTLAKFTRREHYRVFREALKHRLELAGAADPSTFVYDPINCGFCSRVDCPVRIDFCIRLSLENPDPTTMETKEIASLKRHSNVLKSLAKQVDEEAKRRMLEDGEEVEGYEIVEKVRSREVIGHKNLCALHPLMLELGIPEGGNSLTNIVSVSWSDVEQVVLDVIPGKEGKTIFKTLTERMEAAGALTVNKYLTLAAKKD